MGQELRNLILAGGEGQKSRTGAKENKGFSTTVSL